MGATVIEQDAAEYLERGGDRQFDIVFLDPPFAADLLAETCRLLAARQLLADGALVYLEQDRKGVEPDLPGGWQMLKSKTAGNVRYMLARVAEDD